MTQKSRQRTEKKEEIADPPARRRVGRLTTVRGVRRELAAIYRETYAGAMPWSDASKAANLLAVLGRLIEGTELAKQVSDLEAKLENLGV